MIEKGIKEQDGLKGHFPGITEISGNEDASGLRFAIVVSRFNTELTSALASNVISTLEAQGADASSITVIWVPGAYEIPSAIEQAVSASEYDAVLALGAVIEGETPHAEIINNYITGAIGELSRQHGIPVLDGVVATRTMEQAVARCISDDEGRGPYLARAAIETANVFKAIRNQGR